MDGLLLEEEIDENYEPTDEGCYETLIQRKT